MKTCQCKYVLPLKNVYQSRYVSHRMLFSHRMLWRVFLFLWQIQGSYAQHVSTENFRLKECVQYTLTHHPNSTIYSNNVTIQRQKVKESRSAFLPTISGSASFDYNIKLQTSIIPAGSFGSTETRLQIGNKFSTGAYIQADQNLFDRSKRFDIQTARINKEISDINVYKENETLIYNTSSAYYQALTYSEKGKLLRENESQHNQLLEITKLRYQQGDIKKSEYDRARVNLNNIQAELALNENNYELSLNKLKNVMGMDLNASIRVEDSVSYTDKVAMPVVSEFTSEQVLDYKIDVKNLLLKQIDIKQKQSAFLPTVSAYAKYGANAYGRELSSAFDNWFDYSAVGLKVNVPIFSGLKKTSQLQQSKLNAINEQLTVKLNNDTYKLDYKNAASQLFSSYTSLIKNKENLDLAKEVLEATGIEYREGSATMSTFLDADYSYKEAQSNYITSLLDFLTAQLSFEKARGTLTTYITNLK